MIEPMSSKCSGDAWPTSHKSDADEIKSNLSIKRNAIDASNTFESTDHNTGHAQPASNDIDFPTKEHKASDAHVFRHPYFWEDTGNFILQVGSTLFRVHDSTLARHSPMFADIIRQKPKFDIGGALSHCFILDYMDVKDLEILLDAMENAITYHIETPSFDYIASLLRTSTTLNFPKFREFAIHCLNEAWPSDLENFVVGFKWHEHAAETVTLARTFDVPSLLKRALYELLRTPGFSKDPANDLSKDDIIILSRAREHLSHAWIKAAIIPDSKPCVQSLQTCAGIQQKQLLATNGISAFNYDPIRGLVCAAGITDTLRVAGVICEWCATVKMYELMERRTEIWDKLDEWLQLN